VEEAAIVVGRWASILNITCNPKLTLTPPVHHPPKPPLHSISIPKPNPLKPPTNNKPK